MVSETPTQQVRTLPGEVFQVRLFSPVDDSSLDPSIDRYVRPILPYLTTVCLVSTHVGPTFNAKQLLRYPVQ